jgi:hypothetical protein
MFGPHMSGTLPEWLDILPLLPAGTPIVSTDDLHLLRDSKAVNSGLLTIYRKIWDRHGEQQPFSTDFNAMRDMARRFFGSFIDNTWREQALWEHIDVVKELNEYVANTQTEDERQRILTWLRAVTSVWNDEYRGKPILGNRDIPLALISAPIGNDIDPRFARVAYETGNWLSYHNYTHFSNGVRDPLDAKYHSGRWMEMDARYVAEGIYVNWVSTEGGPYFGVYDGWKHPQVLSGNLDRYIDECVLYQLNLVSSWNAQNGSRYHGGVFFTTTRSGWDHYRLNVQEWLRIAKVIRDYQPTGGSTPPPVTPPPHGNVDEFLLDHGRSTIIVGNENALQQAIWNDGWDIAGGESTVMGPDGKMYVTQAAVNRNDVTDLRVYFAEIPYWSNVFWVAEKKA